MVLRHAIVHQAFGHVQACKVPGPARQARVNADRRLRLAPQQALASGQSLEIDYHDIFSGTQPEVRPDLLLHFRALNQANRQHAHEHRLRWGYFKHLELLCSRVLNYTHRFLLWVLVSAAYYRRGQWMDVESEDIHVWVLWQAWVRAQVETRNQQNQRQDHLLHCALYLWGKSLPKVLYHQWIIVEPMHYYWPRKRPAQMRLLQRRPVQLLRPPAIITHWQHPANRSQTQCPVRPWSKWLPITRIRLPHHLSQTHRLPHHLLSLVNPHIHALVVPGKQGITPSQDYQHCKLSRLETLQPPHPLFCPILNPTASSYLKLRRLHLNLKPQNPFQYWSELRLKRNPQENQDSNQNLKQHNLHDVPVGKSRNRTPGLLDNPGSQNIHPQFFQQRSIKRVVNQLSWRSYNCDRFCVHWWGRALLRMWL